MKDQLLNLAEKAANYKRGGNHLLKAINEVQEILTNLLGDYSQFRFTHESVAYLGNLYTSNVGEYGPALCYAEAYGEGRARYKPMPPTWTDAGSGFYLHNDFKAWIDTATRSEIVKVAASLPDFLKALATFLEQKGNENDNAASVIQKIADCIRTATK